MCSPSTLVFVRQPYQNNREARWITTARAPLAQRESPHQHRGTCPLCSSADFHVRFQGTGRREAIARLESCLESNQMHRFVLLASDVHRVHCSIFRHVPRRQHRTGSLEPGRQSNHFLPSEQRHYDVDERQQIYARISPC